MGCLFLIRVNVGIQARQKHDAHVKTAKWMCIIKCRNKTKNNFSVPISQLRLLPARRQLIINKLLIALQSPLKYLSTFGQEKEKWPQDQLKRWGKQLRNKEVCVREKCEINDVSGTTLLEKNVWRFICILPETSFISHFPGPRLLYQVSFCLSVFGFIRPDITIMVDWALKINYLSSDFTLFFLIHFIVRILTQKMFLPRYETRSSTEKTALQDRPARSQKTRGDWSLS